MVIGLEWVRIGVEEVVGTGDKAHLNGHGPADGTVREIARNRSSFWILHVGLRAGSGERRREYPSSTPVEEEV